jgi:poly-beta-1,6-N-acetyl-D-glucosamine synthase
VKYILITAARNEERLIGGTLRSVTAQTSLPSRWVIVDDGSTDQTAEIVRRYAERHPWIELVQRPKRLDRSFAGKAHAFNAELERVRTLEIEVVGNLDADVSFDPDYMAFVI